MANCWPEDQGQVFFPQWNLSFGKTLDQVHFICKKTTLKVAKYDLNIFCLTVSVYEFFNDPHKYYYTVSQKKPDP